MQKQATLSNQFSPVNNCLAKQTMKCKKCSGNLEVHRMCRKVRMRCAACGQEYQIHEVAKDLDTETEKILEKYTSIIYD